MEAVLKSLQTLFLGLPDGVLQAWGLGAYLAGWVFLVLVPLGGKAPPGTV